MPDYPNIVICQCDQLRAFNVGCYGDQVVHTPNIDHLASVGVRFETAVTNNPVCTPARSSLLSGQYSRTCTGMLGNVHQDPPNSERVRLLSPTLPEILRDNGYQTALIGKWHIDPQPQLMGFDKALYPKVAHRYYGQTVFDEFAHNRVVDEFLEDFFAEQVQHFLRKASGQPFFLFYSISLPHQPIGPGHLPSRYTVMYDREAIKLRVNALSDGQPSWDPFWFSVYTSADYYWRYLRKEPQNPVDIVPEVFDLADLTRLYYGAVTCVDDLLGRLLENLTENKLDENTIIVFLSDHGDNLGSHGLFNKNSLIEESIRIPLIVFDPLHRQVATDTEHIASIIDIVPTILQLAGLAVPDYVQGQSLLPLFSGNSMGSMFDKAFIETGPMIGVRTPHYLYGLPYDAALHRISEGETWFFDLADDPYELNNLAARNAQSDIKLSLHNMLLEWNQNTTWSVAPEHIPHY
jgi:arylsulfatase A-like enzyme